MGWDAQSTRDPSEKGRITSGTTAETTLPRKPDLAGSREMAGPSTGVLGPRNRCLGAKAPPSRLVLRGFAHTTCPAVPGAHGLLVALIRVTGLRLLAPELLQVLESLSRPNAVPPAGVWE